MFMNIILHVLSGKSLKSVTDFFVSRSCFISTVSSFSLGLYVVSVLNETATSPRCERVASSRTLSFNQAP